MNREQQRNLLKTALGCILKMKTAFERYEIHEESARHSIRSKDGKLIPFNLKWAEENLKEAKENFHKARSFLSGILLPAEKCKWEETTNTFEDQLFITDCKGSDGCNNEYAFFCDAGPDEFSSRLRYCPFCGRETEPVFEQGGENRDA